MDNDCWKRPYKFRSTSQPPLVHSIFCARQSVPFLTCRVLAAVDDWQHNVRTPSSVGLLPVSPSSFCFLVHGEAKGHDAVQDSYCISSPHSEYVSRGVLRLQDGRTAYSSGSPNRYHDYRNPIPMFSRGSLVLTMAECGWHIVRYSTGNDLYKFTARLKRWGK